MVASCTLCFFLFPFHVGQRVSLLVVIASYGTDGWTREEKQSATLADTYQLVPGPGIYSWACRKIGILSHSRQVRSTVDRSITILDLPSTGRKRTTGRAVRGGADQIHMVGPTPVSFFIPPHLISSRRPSSSSIQGPASSFLLRLLFVFLLLSLYLCWIPSLRRMRAGASPQRATR